ncbi:MAG: GIY-YIG nuclease family protein [Lachnospiraceae bacterium]|nr:GIY-YIG nuclease family protein [Lachnospiraceae bacterium]
MSILFFSDVIKKAGIDPKNVKLIRHSLTDKLFKECYDKGKVYEYTCHQKKDFSRDYEYWAVFISGSGTLAKFYSIYKVGSSKPDTKDNIPEGVPEKEALNYQGEYAIYDLTRVDALAEMEGKLTIDWGNSTRMWHQKGTTEKPVVYILPDEKKVFTGFENLVKTYDELKEIIENREVYEAWHTALSSVYAIYLIVDTETGKQYVGSAYGKDGVLGRWAVYVQTRHGNNKEMKRVICNYPERYHAFQFSILQILPKTITDEEVIHIESLWKDKLLSTKFGMNDN